MDRLVPIDKIEDTQYIDGIFYLRISDLNTDNEIRNKIISENSAWLQEHSDKEGYLRQKVNIRIYQKFRFLITDQSKGIIMSVSKTVNS